MNRIFLMIMLFCVVTSVAAQTTEKPAATGSLFHDNAPGVNLVTDFKAHALGDLVFIEVVEISTATVSSNAARGRDSSTLGGLVGLIAALPAPGAALTSGVVGGLGQRKFEGKGSTGRQSSLRARIAARVVEVLPNGDLRIEAEKVLKVNKEDERLILSGIARTRDISADNVVPSTLVGDLKVALNGKGVASADNQPGWLFRLLDKVSPF
ncbi:MAG TPA: flagellar basal body L-ring protein FlgH [Pyrinomonadaceae bacterium]|nr:flagellar basal body L-ring protein FlgH [Pyrinomonadaceae bacterium]